MVAPPILVEDDCQKSSKWVRNFPKVWGKNWEQKDYRNHHYRLILSWLLYSGIAWGPGVQSINIYIYINKYVHVTYIIYKYIRAKSPGYHQNCWQIATLWIIWGSSSISQGGDRPPNQIYITKNNNEQIKITNAQFGQHHKLTSHRHNIETCGKITWFLFLKQTHLNI